MIAPIAIMAVKAGEMVTLLMFLFMRFRLMHR